MTSPTAPSVSTQGPGQLWTEDRAGDGVPLVLLHPGITDSRIWEPLLPHLAGRRVVRFDRRGFGRTPISTEPFLPTNDLATVIDGLGLEQVHLVGNSMGGETSLAYAVAHPERVASMTLLCPGISGYPWPESSPEDAELEEAWGAAKQAGDVETLRELAIGQWYADGADDYLREQMTLTMAADAAQGELEQEHPAHWEAVAGLGMPVTVIAAEKDPRDSLQASLDLAEKVPGARLVRLDTDHVPQYRMPAEVAAAVLG